MSAAGTSPLVTQDYQDDLAQRGQSLYETNLKAFLEPERNDEYVVIHVDTGDYAVAKTFREAKRSMLARRPIDGRLFGRKIGPEPDDDAFTTRMLASEIRTSRSK